MVTLELSIHIVAVYVTTYREFESSNTLSRVGVYIAKWFYHEYV